MTARTSTTTTVRLLCSATLVAALAFGTTSALAADEFKKCRACHTVDGGSKLKAGPDLKGVMNRTIGSQPGKKKLTDGFKAIAAKGIPWDDALMDEYLTNPTAFVQKHSGDPKAKSGMGVSEKNADKRAALIEYMKGL